jgi:hypothetical protein
METSRDNIVIPLLFYLLLHGSLQKGSYHEHCGDSFVSKHDKCCIFICKPKKDAELGLQREAVRNMKVWGKL